MSNNGISVLITTYINDDVTFFKVALSSVIQQTMKPNEIVIVLDGPVNKQITDYLDSISHDIQNIVFKVIQLDENVGLANALNAGLKHCSYDYIARMDSDDYSKEDRFQLQYDFMENNPNVDMCGTHYEQYDAKLENILSIREVPESGNELIKFSKYRTPVNHVTIMFKRSCYSMGIKYPKTREPFEDWWFALQFINNNLKIHNLPISTVKVRGGEAFTDRRRGFKYALIEQRNIHRMYKAGLISFKDRAINYIVRFPLRLIPYSILTYFYQRFLRKRHDNF